VALVSARKSVAASSFSDSRALRQSPNWVNNTKTGDINRVRRGGDALTGNIVFTLYRFFQNVLVYQPPQEPKPFVLDENEGDDKPQPNAKHPEFSGASKELNTLFAKARRCQQLPTWNTDFFEDCLPCPIKFLIKNARYLR